MNMMRKIIKRLFISAITFILLIVAIFISVIDIISVPLKSGPVKY